MFTYSDGYPTRAHIEVSCLILYYDQQLICTDNMCTGGGPDPPQQIQGVTEKVLCFAASSFNSFSEFGTDAWVVNLTNLADVPINGSSFVPFPILLADIHPETGTVTMTGCLTISAEEGRLVPSGGDNMVINSDGTCSTCSTYKPKMVTWSDSALQACLNENSTAPGDLSLWFFNYGQCMWECRARGILNDREMIDPTTCEITCLPGFMKGASGHCTSTISPLSPMHGEKTLTKPRMAS